ncbi:polysaccharide biosynthesis/export family protein [Alkalinema sp. FACHB-956]|uniref:polysaccharide biosynthesis/export family protein n=1 Tax=Alkalinema sp. FACHB-956 TaxID=2692768 RepID=UPI0016881CAF|nr:polysaccharide biosynthesis/export family protein [Alkalinema sp. FACHB-956]MBD2326602.1 polysaccharide export protein [Alkalinema sp. FACHB-956]
MAVPPSPIRHSVRWTALSIASLHTTLQISLGVLAGSTWMRPSLAQTPPPPTLEPDRRPTALDLVEQARQRLRDRGELPPADAPSLPQSVTGTGSSPAADSTAIPTFGQYRLGSGDVVSVFVQRFQDFSFQAAIDPEGKITHPVLGKIELQGLTIDEAQTRVQQAVSRYIINPIVLLSLANQRAVQVTVTGEVVRPGLYPLGNQPQRVSSVLLAAGGTTDQADLREVKVRRAMPNGTTIEESLDLFTPLKTGTSLPDARLQDGDVILVTKLQPDKLQDYDRSIVARSTLVKPQLTIRVLSYARGGLGEVIVPNGSKFVDALAKVGLNPDAANLRKIAVVRFDNVQQKAVTFQLDGKKAIMGDMTQNIALQDNDVIVIGRNLVGRITYALNVFTQPFRDVLGFLLFFRELGNSATNLFRPSGQE